jgi:hypothetical protein
LDRRHRLLALRPVILLLAPTPDAAPLARHSGKAKRSKRVIKPFTKPAGMTLCGLQEEASLQRSWLRARCRVSGLVLQDTLSKLCNFFGERRTLGGA